MPQLSVAVLGASTNRSKYGNKSVRAHLAQGYEVYPINPKATEIEGLTAYASLADLPVEHVTRISLYLPPALTLSVLDEIAAIKHDELFLNPGTESEEVIARAVELGLEPIQACSIVDVGMSPYDLAE